MMGNAGLTLNEFDKLMKDGVTVIDLRPSNVFPSQYILHSIHIELDEYFEIHSDFFISKDQAIVLICEERKEAKSVEILEDMGYENIKGYLAGGIQPWLDHKRPIDVVISIDPEELNLEIKFGKINLYDIRHPEQFFRKRIKNSENIDIEALIENTDVIDKKALCCFYCEDGKLSLSLISYLKSLNIHNAYHIKGGFNNIQKNKEIEMISGV